MAWAFKSLVGTPFILKHLGVVNLLKGHSTNHMLVQIRMQVPLPPCGLHGYYETTTTTPFTVFSITSTIYKGLKLDAYGPSSITSTNSQHDYFVKSISNFLKYIIIYIVTLGCLRQ